MRVTIQTMLRDCGWNGNRTVYSVAREIEELNKSDRLIALEEVKKREFRVKALNLGALVVQIGLEAITLRAGDWDGSTLLVVSMIWTCYGRICADEHYGLLRYATSKKD